MAITAADVAAWGRLTLPDQFTDDRNLMDRVVDAVIEHIAEHYEVSTPLSPAQEQAALIQAARLWRRRDTPEGVIAFDEIGAVRLSRLDTDVAMLLTPKAWGFA